MHCGQHGKGLLWGGSFPYLDAQGVGVAHFAKIMLEDKGLSLVGKKCVITGSSHVSHYKVMCRCLSWRDSYDCASDIVFDSFLVCKNILLL